jgi:death on curing protein
VAWHYLDLADFLLIAEVVLQTPADDLARVTRVDLAESALHAPAAAFGGVAFYPDLASKTAVLCSRIIRNHPLPDGNERLGYLCALEFVARNGGRWTPPKNDPEGDETVAVIEALAAGELGEEDFTAWVRDRLR